MRGALTLLASGSVASALLLAGQTATAADDRALCVERMRHLDAEPRSAGSPELGACVRADIASGQIDMQSMGFAVMSDEPGPNVRKLIDAGFPARTGQGAMVIGTLNKLYLEGKLTGETYLAASAPLIDAGALVLFGDGPLDILSELLRSAPEPETICGFAAIVGGFDVFEDRELPRSLAATNPAFGPAEREVLAGCGL